MKAEESNAKATSTRKRGPSAVVPRPFLKWAGGKGQIVGVLERLAPKEFGAYHEPFVGGGALFFALARAGRLSGKKVHLSDINAELVATWKAVRDDVSEVIGQLQKHRYEREYYYRVRDQDPEKLPPADLAARMIFLNRCGFNGLYRVNSKGKFNVPFGRYKNPLICDRENLEAVSKVLDGVNIECEPFERVLTRARRGDFVYFDPPYVPLSKTSSFVSYAKDGFGLEDQERLAEVFGKLARRGVRVMLSNSDTPFVRDLYRDYLLVPVKAKRPINSRGNRRGPIGELVVLSYHVEAGFPEHKSP
ncbi:MAG: DNA adenine methylase [Deltaproteobacteria bacterium]|nr:MAG: DNA adenine methylase [Deltaproteobacteria bacterium]